MGFKNRDVISIHEFSKDEILHILKVAEQLEKNPKPDLLKGKVMAVVFYEPSTRTRLSFTTAMEQLGGEILDFGTTDRTSVKKGETLWDTMKMLDAYSDIIVIRHPLEGSARLAAEASDNPVLNGGDGANQHPTQTLLDLYTIKKLKGKLTGLKIGMLGDLKYGRTVHSLATAMVHFNPEFKFIAPQALQMPKEYLDMLDKHRIPYTLEADMTDSINDLDILYVTRIQQERFPDPIEYEKFKGVYKLDKNALKNVKKDLKIMHPLPRVDEISPEVDSTAHAAYFEQAANGVYTRQALLALLLGEIK
ncbi:aspartate carbamoyltransferase [Nanoarchaeota archaeon]